MKLDFAFVSRLKPGHEVSYHSHKSLELVYYAEGSGTLRFGSGPLWEFGSGDFHIAPDGQLHTQTNRDELRALCVGVSGSGLEKLSGLWRDEAGLLRYPLEELFNEVRRKAPAFEKVAEGLLLQVAGLIERIATKPPEKPRAAKESIVEKALRLMRETGGATDLDEIAETLFIGKDYLRHLVTRQTGRSPLKHLIELRMTRAAKLLRERNCGVAEAAKDCGFPDVYYFSRLFKKSFGASPAAYRDAEAGKCKKATRKIHSNH